MKHERSQMFIAASIPAAILIAIPPPLSGWHLAALVAAVSATAALVLLATRRFASARHPSGQDSDSLSTDDGLLLQQEGNACRAKTSVLDYLFRDTAKESLFSAYLRSRYAVALRMKPRWEAVSSRFKMRVGPEALIQELTLHWLYYGVTNGLGASVSDEQLAHPQTRRIIVKHLDGIFGGMDENALLAGAMLFGSSFHDFREASLSDRRFSEM